MTLFVPKNLITNSHQLSLSHSKSRWQMAAIQNTVKWGGAVSYLSAEDTISVFYCTFNFYGSLSSCVWNLQNCGVT